MSTKTIFISGSSRGIGKACALLFARNGWHVFLNSRKQSGDLLNVFRQIKEEGLGSCEMLPGDVSDPNTVEELFRHISKSCLSLNGTPALDVLVNNAGISYLGLLTDMTNEDWRHLLDTNLSSVFYCCRCAIPAMVSQKSGKIINISSMWGTSGASCEAAYSATKAGVHGLTRALAKELAPSNIQVNALACGCVDTSMNSSFTEEERKALEEEIPMGRFASPWETAQMIYELAGSPQYLTGQVIGFDGGFL